MRGPPGMRGLAAEVRAIRSLSNAEARDEVSIAATSMYIETRIVLTLEI